jgi:hypothetical protein
VYDQTGEIPEEMELPELSTAEIHIWDKFVSLQRGRGYGINGPNPISYQDMLAWMSLTGNTLEFWEVDLMMAVDTEYVVSSREEKTDGPR